MAEQWHYSKNNQQHGPVSAARLKELAASGELAPTDLVWKNGMADWQPAAKLKGLFPNRSSVAPSSSSATAPPVPPPAVSPNVHTGSVPVEQSASTPGLGDRLRAFLSTAQEAGRLVAKQTERARVAKVTLPAAFRALGKEIFEARRFESEFPQHFQRLDSLKSELEAIQSRAAESPSPSTFTGKAKGAAKTAKVSAQTKSVELKVASAYTDLGKQTFHSHAETSGPEAVVRPVMDALARLESLDAEIAVLSEKGSGSWITPKRLALGGIATAAIILFIIGSSFFGGGDAAFRRELAGEWRSDNGVVVTFDAHEVVASDGKANFKSVYSTNRSRRTASFRSPNGVDVTATLKDDGRLVLESTAGSGQVTTLRRTVSRTLSGNANKSWLDNSVDVSSDDSFFPGYGGTRRSEANQGALTAEELKRMSYSQIVERLGPPDEDHRSSKKRNVGLAIWKTGDNEYTVVGFVHAIDGSGQTLILSVHDRRPRSIIENMKRGLEASLN